MLRTSIITIVVTLAGLVLMHDWIRTYFAPTPLELAIEKRARSTNPRPTALAAVEKFSHLPPNEQRDLGASLGANLISMQTWLAQLGDANYQVLCLGEDHEPSTREFLARELFARLRFDVVLLEATPREMRRVEEAIEEGETYVPLLAADIAGIVNAARARNPQILIAGIEETKRQRVLRQRGERSGFRDDSIVNNFWGEYRPGKRHAVLIGALHCTDRTRWLFEQMRQMAPRRVAEKMVSIRILGEDQDESMENFVYFLDQIGFEHRDFVITDSNALHPYVYEWFWLLRSTLRPYQTMVVFRNRASLERERSQYR